MFIAKWPFTKQQSRTYLTLPHKQEVFWIESDKNEVLDPAGFGNQAVSVALNLRVSGDIPGSCKVTACAGRALAWNWPFPTSPNSILQAVIFCLGAVYLIWALLQLLWAQSCPSHCWDGKFGCHSWLLSFPCLEAELSLSDKCPWRIATRSVLHSLLSWRGFQQAGRWGSSDMNIWLWWWGQGDQQTKQNRVKLEFREKDNGKVMDQRDECELQGSSESRGSFHLP